jgi:hypothetical protein
MKKVLPFLIVLILLSGCFPSGQVSDAEMATRVAQILTSYPTNTVNPALAPSPMSVEPFNTSLPALAQTAEDTGTPTSAPTETPLPTATETPAAVPTDTPALPTSTIAVTPVAAFTAAPGDPVARLGNPTSSDPMDNAAVWNWTVGPSQFNNIDFRDGALLLTANSDISGWRLAGTESLDNVYIEMVAGLDKCAASDNYGIIFRVPVLREADRGYLFGFTCDGKYYLKMWDGKVSPDGKMTTLISPTRNAAIQPGSHVFNRMGVMAVGNRLLLYANGAYLAEFQDSLYPGGYFGVFVNQDYTPLLTLRVDQMGYWKNPSP